MISIKRKILFSCAILGSLFIISTANAHTMTSVRPAWISEFGWAVGVCETGKGHHHPDFKHHWGAYEGFVGWYSGTWDMDKVGITTIDHAYQASPKIQNKVAAVSFKKRRDFGCINGGGYKYWL